MWSSFVWRMWIEIPKKRRQLPAGKVILRVKDVDWNGTAPDLPHIITVILRVKDVDWNTLSMRSLISSSRHPSCEGCGLKYQAPHGIPPQLRHPSCEGCGLKYLGTGCLWWCPASSFVWRMWIEIQISAVLCLLQYVILRVKDVDWNVGSSSHFTANAVILRVKDVDWNYPHWSIAWSHGRHPSCEGCGLKCDIVELFKLYNGHPSCEGCGLKFILPQMLKLCLRSSFVWRMWIEISWALYGRLLISSSFVWRMWIEISQALWCTLRSWVILRVKDVDWNNHKYFSSNPLQGHPSCEGCGLK